MIYKENPGDFMIREIDILTDLKQNTRAEKRSTSRWLFTTMGTKIKKRQESDVDNFD